MCNVHAFRFVLFLVPYSDIRQLLNSTSTHIFAEFYSVQPQWRHLIRSNCRRSGSDRKIEFVIRHMNVTSSQESVGENYELYFVFRFDELERRAAACNSVLRTVDEMLCSDFLTLSSAFRDFDMNSREFPCTNGDGNISIARRT